MENARESRREIKKAETELIRLEMVNQQILELDRDALTHPNRNKQYRIKRVNRSGIATSVIVLVLLITALLVLLEYLPDFANWFFITIYGHEAFDITLVSLAFLALAALAGYFAAHWRDKHYDEQKDTADPYFAKRKRLKKRQERLSQKVQSALSFVPEDVRSLVQIRRLAEKLEDDPALSLQEAVEAIRPSKEPDGNTKNA